VIVVPRECENAITKQWQKGDEMLLKSADDKSKRAALLEELQRSQLLDPHQKKWLREELMRFALFCFLGGLAAQSISPTVSILFSLGTILPIIAAATRRLHDTNRSGWWQLISLIPIVGWIIIVIFLAHESKSDV